jgi:SAM-dependent methyltransferase
VTDSELMALLRCPRSGQPLRREQDWLVAPAGHRYRLTPSGIPLFAEGLLPSPSARQQALYDKNASAYVDNLTYPHTQEYYAYLDEIFLRLVDRHARLDTMAEICCGRGEALLLLGSRVKKGLGVDISQRILEMGRQQSPQANLAFVQGDATNLPLGQDLFDSVFMLGGIHHVPDRASLFREVFRILKPGGRFFWREPADDFAPWRWLRNLVYKHSQALDEDTEKPLRYRETVDSLQGAGFRPLAWDTYGFLGYCLFMNSDVLVFNSAFRFLPGIRALTRLAARLDHAVLRLPAARLWGTQVIGLAEKPGQA